MKFIHAADLHLDSPFLGLQHLPNALLAQVRASTFTAATKVFDKAIAEHVDFVLLAGDLFDRAEQSVAAQAYLFEQFGRLNDAGIPALISFGNHDYLADQHQTVAYPANVTVFGPEVGTQMLTLASGETVAISGFSYPQRWVPEDQVIQFPTHAATDWHIGMLHGAVSTGSGDHYAPFTVAELLAKHYDYWALGHIHHRQALNDQPPILYAGNTQGRAITETGTKGAYLVTSRTGQLVPEFFETSTINWEMANLSGGDSLQALSQQLADWLTAHPADRTTLTAVTVQLTQPLTGEDAAQLQSGDWLALWQRTQQRVMRAAQRYVVTVNVATQMASVAAPQLDQHYWEQGAAGVFTPENLQQLFGKLNQDPALAEWFTQPQTTKAVEALARQQLAELMGEEGNHEA
ncbi:metallophosphoesterase family protein [Levilactobacillus parabrevis]|uniref:DNA repair exonuclease n=1 Tax=Levilactobacillus parabrevis ATCC 53295 TaxID=1267003 RepID=A0A0R1H0Z6_9LACO|nr:DNA repair exonuclease [Levilactobacillus parabrevis]KRK36874.1 DNA repair exonuclease [Levilactobacillus parabrevis ATCC 53295]KRO06097.1 DNA repair exonuclease [Levilactobacillus parabrevis]